MNHVFGKPEHNFGLTASTKAEQEALMVRMIESVGPLGEGQYSTGAGNAIVRVIDGSSILMEGKVIDGVFRLSTAWLVP